MGYFNYRETDCAAHSYTYNSIKGSDWMFENVFDTATDTVDFLEMMMAHAAACGMEIKEYIELYIQHLRERETVSV